MPTKPDTPEETATTYGLLFNGRITPEETKSKTEMTEEEMFFEVCGFDFPTTL